VKKIIILVCALFLGGCSATFAYNNVSWLIYWYLDDYVELNNKQEDMFDEMLEGWMLWHKQEELPLYQQQLEDIIAQIKSNSIDAQSIASHRERARQHWVRARTHVASDLVTLGSTLSSEQVVYLFASLDKENREDEEEINERLALDESEKIEKWTKKNQKGIKKWTGKLTNEQKNLVASFHGRFESTSQFWLAYKREYQQQLREVFARPQRDAVFEERLYELIVDPEKFRSQPFQTAMDVNAQASTEYILDLMALLSDKQLEKVVKEIEEFRQDAISLQK
jgi:hypothetical protein